MGTLGASGFRFIDLFAGIGGFHAALTAAGGEAVWASEIDEPAARVYAQNWQLEPAGDIVPLSDPKVSREIPAHEVLAAGFPCQPFSKSGHQQGFRDQTRGTLFFNICQILEARKPPVILLENVRNLAGPRQKETWNTIVRSLRELGYRVSSTPTVFSPHLLPLELGGRPQVRERVFITGTRVGRRRALADEDYAPLVPLQPVTDWDPQFWDISDFLDSDAEVDDIDSYRLSPEETRWIEAWDDFVRTLREVRSGMRLPGFPIWADSLVGKLDVPEGTPPWKASFLRKNHEFYLEHSSAIDGWRRRWRALNDFPPSRRKLEWQAQDLETLWDTVMHFRPSGIRAKRPTYLPALVAITQTSIIGSRRRRITPREASRLQGFPEWFTFAGQSDAETYKQLGNGVSIGAAYFIFRSHVLRDEADLSALAPSLVEAVRAAGDKPHLIKPGG